MGGLERSLSPGMGSWNGQQGIDSMFCNVVRNFAARNSDEKPRNAYQARRDARFWKTQRRKSKVLWAYSGRSYVAKRCEACRNRIRPQWNVNFGRKMMAGRCLRRTVSRGSREQFRRGKEEHGGSAADCSRVCSSGSQTGSIGPSTMATQEGCQDRLRDRG